jgi:hypothetical protein
VAPQPQPSPLQRKKKAVAAAAPQRGLQFGSASMEARPELSGELEAARKAQTQAAELVPEPVPARAQLREVEQVRERAQAQRSQRMEDG